MTGDPFHLQRFVDAQASTYEHARAELAAGHKRGHWMWFIFPQIHGLGFSEMSRRYAISGLDEATAYLEHPLLGSRLRDCTALVNAVDNRSLNAILGDPDDMKFYSSVTLFAEAGGGLVFLQALDRFFDGERDQQTLDRITAGPARPPESV